MAVEGHVPIEAIAQPATIWAEVENVYGDHIRRVGESEQLAQFKARHAGEVLVAESGVVEENDPEAQFLVRTVTVLHDIFPQIAGLDLNTPESLTIKDAPGMRRDEFLAAVMITANATGRIFETRWGGVGIAVFPDDTLQDVLARYNERDRALHQAQGIEGVPQD